MRAGVEPNFVQNLQPFPIAAAIQFRPRLHWRCYM